MRKWNLRPGDPLAPIIAADARDGHTDPRHDTVWRLHLGAADEPAFTLETRYGGRVGLARIVPTWVLGKREVRETRDYHVPPALTAIAPDTLCLEAQIAPKLRLRAELWAMASQVVGGRFTVVNATNAPQLLQLDLTTQIAREKQVLRRYFLQLEDGSVALQAAKLSRLQPVLMLRDGLRSPTMRAHLYRTVSIPPKGRARFWWTVASYAQRQDSIKAAHHWLRHADWDAHFATLEAREHTAPQVETGDPAWDAALVWSQQSALRSFVKAAPRYPRPVLVSDRRPETAILQGATLPEAWYAAGAVALADPELAQGLVENFLATQHRDGGVDVRPSLEGRPGVVLAPPRLTLLADVVERLSGFSFPDTIWEHMDLHFWRWTFPQYTDVDADRDGVHEWSHPSQGAFVHGVALAQTPRWAQGLPLETVEAPDLAAYLLADAEILVPEALRYEPSSPIDELVEQLDRLWDDASRSYRYRDRDAHTHPQGELIFSGRGDQALEAPVRLREAGRVLIRISGGMDHKPAVRCTVEGTSWEGQPVRETLTTEKLRWYRGQGVLVTNTVWQEITALYCKGLSRVYHLKAQAANLAREDLGTLIPLIAVKGERAAPMIARLCSPAYWRAFGLSAVPADAPDYDPNGHDGPGGMWPEYAALLGLALVAHGKREASAELFMNVLAAQIATLREAGDFRRYYNAETGTGLGALGSLMGAVSWEWFTTLFGAYVVDVHAVQITGPLAFKEHTITWRQHGITVQRSASGTLITFADGKKLKLPAEQRGTFMR